MARPYEKGEVLPDMTCQLAGFHKPVWISNAAMAAWGDGKDVVNLMQVIDWVQHNRPVPLATPFPVRYGLLELEVTEMPTRYEVRLP